MSALDGCQELWGVGGSCMCLGAWRLWLTNSVPVFGKITKVPVNVCLYVCKLDVYVHSLMDSSHSRDARLSSRAENHCCHVLEPSWMTLTLFWRWEAVYGWDLPNCRGLHAYPFKLQICTTWLWTFQSVFLPAFSESHLETDLQYLSIDNSAHGKDKSTQRAIDRSIEIRMIQKSLCQQSTQNNSYEWPSSTKIHATYFRSDIFIFILVLPHVMVFPQEVMTRCFGLCPVWVRFWHLQEDGSLYMWPQPGH